MDNDENLKCCWICFGNSDEDETAEWVKPCKCRGTVKWVHQKCLQRWIDVKVNGFSKISCNRCGFKYVLHPQMGNFLNTFENMYKFVVHSNPTIGLIMQMADMRRTLLRNKLYAGRFPCIRLIPAIDQGKFEHGLVVFGFFIGVTVLKLCTPLENKVVLCLGDLTCNENDKRPYEFPDEARNWKDDFITNVAIMPFAARIVGFILFEDLTKNPFRKALISLGLVFSFKFVCNVSYKYLQLLRSNRVRILDCDE